MSRKIKFRAWDKEEKEMSYDTNDIAMNLLDHKDFKVMQYTGLCDKNGKEIYEGDILKNTDTEQKYEVRYNEEQAMHEYICVVRATRFWHQHINWIRIEIIGNIHENKDLLN